MAKTVLKLKNPYTEDTKTTPLGFSWSVLLFGFLVPFSRKDWKMTLIMLFFNVITLGFASFFFAFTYNNSYAKSLFARDYLLIYFWGPLSWKKLYKLMAISLND